MSLGTWRINSLKEKERLTAVCFFSFQRLTVNDSAPDQRKETVLSHAQPQPHFSFIWMLRLVLKVLRPNPSSSRDMELGPQESMGSGMPS